MKPVFALVDCNNFFVSCELVFQPGLREKPVVVLSNNDGCIISRSPAAKTLGIKMGAPAYPYQSLFQRHQVTLFSANYTLYGDLSLRVMNTLRTLAPALEVYSIDEAFLDLSGRQATELECYGKKIRETVLRWTGIPVSVGIGATKTLAKAGSELAKQEEGVFVLYEDNSEKLKELKIEEVWGIGPAYASFLNRQGIRTVGDYLQTDDVWIKKHLSVLGLRIKQELLGRACLPLELLHPLQKSICTSRSFGSPQSAPASLEEAVGTFTTRCAEKLRADHCCADRLTVFLHPHPFRPLSQGQFPQGTVHLPVATNSSFELVREALKILKNIYLPGIRYRKAGVVLSGIVEEKEIQTTLFDPVNREKERTIMVAMDQINQNFGREVVKIAALGTGGSWKWKQERRSPCYTTSWDQLMTIRV